MPGSRKGSLLSEKSFGSVKRHVHDDDTIYKAAYLTVLQDIDESIHTRQELAQVLQYAGKNPTAKHINTIWSNCAGAISYEEYCKIARDIKPTNRTQLISAFKKIDVNGDGFISESELYKVLTSRGEKMTHGEVKKILDLADVNKDGKLDYEEFATMVMSTSNECKNFNVQKMLSAQNTSYSNTQRPVPTKRSSTARTNSTLSRKETQDHLNHEKTSQSSTVRPSSAASKTDQVFLQRLDNAIKVQGSGRTLKSSADHPKTLKGWNHVHSKGCFRIDEDEGNVIVSHIYKLELPFASNVWITMKPYLITGNGEGHVSNVDMGVFIFRDSEKGESTLVALTEFKDEQQWYWRGDLRSGSYKIVPYTTGCWLKPRRGNILGDVKLVQKDQNNEYQLSRAFKAALGEVFQMCDLDGNGLLSRDEFNWYQMITNDEEVDDDAWQVVLDNLEVKNDQITKEGFIKLHLMEAQEDGADSQQELGDMLKHMGFNTNLEMDQGCPFELNIHAKDCKASLSVSHAGSGKDEDITNGFIDSIIQKNVSHRVTCNDGLVWHIYTSDFRTSTMLDNKTSQTIRCEADCSMSKNCMTMKGKNVVPLQILPYSKTLVDHAIPVSPQNEWLYHCIVSNTPSNASRKTSNASRRSNNRKDSSLRELFD